jgi:hypothetical protein
MICNVHIHLTAGEFPEFLRQFPAFAKAFEIAGAEPDPAQGVNDAHTRDGNDAEEPPHFPVLEKTRQQALSMFENAAKQQGLALRKASGTDVFDYVVTGNRERPVVISASTDPRILLRAKWSGIQGLVIAFVWLAQNCIIIAEYNDVARVLGNALKTKSFTSGSKYYTTASSVKCTGMRPFVENWSLFL